MKSKQKPPVLRRIKKKTGEVNAAALVEANPGGRPRSEVGVQRVTSGAIQIALPTVHKAGDVPSRDCPRSRYRCRETRYWPSRETARWFACLPAIQEFQQHPSIEHSVRYVPSSTRSWARCIFPLEQFFLPDAIVGGAVLLIVETD